MSWPRCDRLTVRLPVELKFTLRRPSDRPTPCPTHPRAEAPACRSGFTLIEVLTALMITGIVGLLAHRLMSVTIDGVHQLEHVRLEHDRRENGRRWMRSALLSLEAGGTDGAFEGVPGQLTFGAWLEQPGGWSTLQRVRIELRNGRAIASAGKAESLLLADSVTALSFDYLLEPGLETKWVQEWLSPLSAPLAVRMRLTRREYGFEQSDTLLFLIKERG